MATSINTRISDDLEKKLKILQSDIKSQSPRGSEVTYSSMVRGGLEKLIEEYDEKQNGVLNLKFDLGSMNSSELSILKTLISKILEFEEVFPLAIWKNSPDTKPREYLETKLIQLQNAIDLQEVKNNILEGENKCL